MSWMQEVYSIQWKFQGKRKLFKILDDKNYKQYSIQIQSTLCVSGQAQVAKNPEREKYIQYSGKLCFSGLAQSCSKILNGKKYIQDSENFSVYSLGGEPCNWATAVCNMDQSRDWL